MELSPDTPVFTIGVVKKMTGLTARQIRYYDQTGLVVPERSTGNKRLYSAKEVNILLKIKEIIRPGMKISQVKEILDSWQEPFPEKSGGIGSRDQSYPGYLPARSRSQRLYAPGYLDELLSRLLREEKGN